MPYSDYAARKLTWTSQTADIQNAHVHSFPFSVVDINTAEEFQGPNLDLWLRRMRFSIPLTTCL